MPDQIEWPAFAGIDWGGQHHQLCVVDAAGQRLLQLRVSHDVAGLPELDRQFGRFGERLPVAIERSEGLLVEHLPGSGHAVFPVSPRISARARERYKVAAVKDDRFDAFVLAEQHDEWAEMRRYIGLEVLANSRAAGTAANAAEEVTLTAITA